MNPTILRALCDCEHREPIGSWCPTCGSLRCADGEWVLPELVSELVLEDKQRDLLSVSASARGAIEWIGAHPRAESDLEETIRAMSGPTVALLVVNGLAQIFDGKGPRCRVTLSDRGVVELDHWRAVSALDHVCICGHDRGDHAVQSPSPCETCECVGFAHTASAATDPPTSADATTPGVELELVDDETPPNAAAGAAWRQGGGR